MLDNVLLEPVRIRAPQINGCARCIHDQVTEARSQGGLHDSLAISVESRLAGHHAAVERVTART